MGGFASNFHTEYAVIDVVWINELIRSTAQESNPSVPAEVTLFSSRNGQTNSVSLWPSVETYPIIPAISRHSNRCCFRDVESSEVSAVRAWAPLKYTPFKISIVGSAAVVRWRNISTDKCVDTHWKGTCMMPYTRRCRKRGNSRARALQFGRITSLR